MATVNFVPDAARPPIDARLEELAAAAVAAGKPIRIRLQPDIYEYATQRNQKWYGLIWSVELEDVEEGRRLREGLTLFFRKFGEGVESQKKLMAGLRNGKGKKAPVVIAAGAEVDPLTAEEPK